MSADSCSNLMLDSLISQLESGFYDGLEGFGGCHWDSISGAALFLLFQFLAKFFLILCILLTMENLKAGDKNFTLCKSETSLKCVPLGRANVNK